MKLLIYTAVLIKMFFFQLLIADELFLNGKEIFLNAGNCATCHSLKDAGSNAMVGPNLNEIRPDIGRVKNAVLNGIGVMPAYQGILSGEEIDAVSYYVSESVNN
jgi:cytochrome c6